MKGILIDTHGVQFVDFVKPEDVFFTNEFTIVCACPEESLIVVGYTDNVNKPCLLSEKALHLLNYDVPPGGRLLVTKNDVNGLLIDVTQYDIDMFN